MQNTGKSESTSPKIKEVRILSKTEHDNIVEFKVSGDLALFADVLTRPGGEKFSYPIPTYEALKGILMSIYWKPTIIWVIDECRVMNKISMERKGIRPIKYGGGNDLSYYTYLKDVEYRVRAHFEWNDNRPELEKDRNENKHHNIAKRMIQRGGRRDIFLGTRECMGYVEPCSYDEGVSYYQGTEIPYGFMYHGITYADEAEREEDKGKLTVRFWRPVMKDGVIKFDHPNDISESQKRHIRDMKIKPFDKDLDNFSGLEEFDYIGGGDDIELD